MRDKRPVDELSIEELERILAIRKREARQARLRGYEGSGRRVAPNIAPGDDLPPSVAAPAALAETQLAPQTVIAPLAPAAAPDTYYEDEPRFEDELSARRQAARTPGVSTRGVVWNRALMLVEIAAVFGLIMLFVGLFQSLQSVTQVSADMQSQYQATANARLIPPTATPVINIDAVVLPVGHTFNMNANGVISTSINLDEVPAQYRDQYLTLMTQPVSQPPTSPEGPISILIPKINVKATVVEGDNWGALQLGVGHHIGSANPGQRGNMVLSGHDDVYGEIFKDLDKLKPGDLVTVETMSKPYTYVVQDQKIVSPTDVWVLDSRGDQRQLTMITCYPYRVDTKRIVVFATLAS